MHRTILEHKYCDTVSVSITVPTKTDKRRIARTSQDNAVANAEAFQIIQTSDGEREEVFRGRLDAEWCYEKRLTRQDGSWIVSELRVFPASRQTDARAKISNADSHRIVLPPGGLTARHLRRISFNESPLKNLRALDAVCVRLFKTRRARLAAILNLRRLKRNVTERSSTIQARWIRDLELAEIANLYVEARDRRSRRPNVEIASMLGTTPEKIRDAVHLARNRGLLTSDAGKRQGSAKGELTDVAKRLLATADHIRSGESTRGWLADTMSRSASGERMRGE